GVAAAPDHVGGDFEPVDEAEAGGVYVHRSRLPGTQMLLHHAGRGRDDGVTTAGGDQEKVDVIGCLAGSGESTVACHGRQLGGLDMADPALLDTGPGGNPLVGGVHDLFQVVVGQDVRG